MSEATHEYPSCFIKPLPRELIVPAARTSVLIRPENHPNAGPDEGPLRRQTDVPLQPARAAMLTTAYWGISGANLGVQFLDTNDATLKAMILQCANMWGKRANVRFFETWFDAQIRITRTPGGGYYSYLGNGALQIPGNENTMNLDSFTVQTPWSEYLRVVCHEFGHALGLIHEHMRQELVAKLIPEATIALYEQTQGWSELQIRQQVLTPQDESAIFFKTAPDPNSIMCYQIPGSITIDHQPIAGGTEIDDNDYNLIGFLYPLSESV